MRGRKRTMSSPLEPTDRSARVTEATAADAQALAALYAEALPPGWPAHELAAACADKNRIILKASSASHLHGFIVLQFAADEAEVLALAVAKAWRRMGYAASLLQAAIRACQRRFISCIYLEVAESNEPALKLYEKIGFVETGRRENYYRSPSFGPQAAILMRRDAKLPAPVDPEKSCP